MFAYTTVDLEIATGIYIYILQYRRIRGDMIEVFKIMNKHYDEEASVHLPEAVGVTRGHIMKLFHRRCDKDLRKFFFSNRVVSVWNTLPNEVVTAPSIDSFKNELDKFWEQQPARFSYEEPYLHGAGLKIYLAKQW